MTKIVGTTTTGIIFSDASPKKPGESIAEYIERQIDEAEEVITNESGKHDTDC